MRLHSTNPAALAVILVLSSGSARASEDGSPATVAALASSPTRPDNQGLLMTVSTAILQGGNAGLALNANAQVLYHRSIVRVGGTAEAAGGFMAIGNGGRYGEGALLGVGLRLGWFAADALAEGGAFQYLGYSSTSCFLAFDGGCTPTPGYTRTVGYAGGRLNLELIATPDADSHLRVLPVLSLLVRHELGATGNMGTEVGLGLGAGFDLF